MDLANYSLPLTGGPNIAVRPSSLGHSARKWAFLRMLEGELPSALAESTKVLSSRVGSIPSGKPARAMIVRRDALAGTLNYHGPSLYPLRSSSPLRVPSPNCPRPNPRIGADGSSVHYVATKSPSWPEGLRGYLTSKEVTLPHSTRYEPPFTCPRHHPSRAFTGSHPPSTEGERLAQRRAMARPSVVGTAGGRPCPHLLSLDPSL